jgi:hypothetical protein
LLNEFYQVDRSLRSAGIAVGVRHPDIKAPGKTEILRVRMAAGNGVTQVDVLTPEEASVRWSLRDGNHNSFPDVKIKLPLFTISKNDPNLVIAIDNNAALGKRTEACCELGKKGIWIANSPTDKWAKWLKKQTGYTVRLRERLNQLSSLKDTDAAAVPAVMERFLIAFTDPSSFLRSIWEAIAKTLQEEPTPSLVDMAVQLAFIGDGAFYLDIDRFDNFSFDAGDPSNIPAISKALARSMPLREADPQSRCAVSGRIANLVQDKFPQPNLPILGQTYLFTKNRDTPSSMRYGCSGPEGLAVAEDTAAGLLSASLAITHSSRKGKTWAPVPSENPGDADLLIAYVPAAPEIELAGIIAQDPVAEDPRKSADFGEKTRVAIEAAKGELLDYKRSPLRVIVVRKIDPANRKVIFASDGQSIEKLLAAAKQWSQGCKNVPPWLRLPVSGAKGESWRWCPPPSIAPASLVYLSKLQFIRGGLDRQEIPGRPLAVAMELLWAEPARASRVAGELLTIFVRRHGVLLIGVGAAQRRGLGAGKRKDSEFAKFDRQTALRSIAALGLLLHKLDRFTETYMSNAAFQLGQLLAAADVLHKGYCCEVRGGSIPQQLMGNALMPMAQVNPTGALAALGRRWCVYQAWAMRHAPVEAPLPKSRGEDAQRTWDVKCALSTARRLNGLAKDLQQGLTAAHVINDAFRAEMLLGYIAGLPPVAFEETLAVEPDGVIPLDSNP